MMIALPHTVNPYKKKYWRLKYWTMKLKEGKSKEWTHKMKEWKMKSYLLIKNDIAYRILPPSTSMAEEPIGPL